MRKRLYGPAGNIPTFGPTQGPVRSPPLIDTDELRQAEHEDQRHAEQAHREGDHHDAHPVAPERGTQAGEAQHRREEHREQDEVVPGLVRVRASAVMLSAWLARPSALARCAHRVSLSLGALHEARVALVGRGDVGPRVHSATSLAPSGRRTLRRRALASGSIMGWMGAMYEREASLRPRLAPRTAPARRSGSGPHAR